MQTFSILKMYLGYFMCLCFVIEETLSSNFRGGVMSVEPTARPDMVQIRYRLSWQQSYAEGYFCNESTIASSKIISVDGTLKSRGKCSGVTISPLPLQCTEYSTIDDWMSGVFSASLKCDKSSIQIWFEATGWPKLNNGHGEVSLHLNSSMIIRKDTGRINSSPIAKMEPIIRILKDCSQVIKISVSDIDADLIRCRWSRKEPENECGGVCKRIHGLILEEDTCQLYFERDSAVPGKYAVTLQIEDYELTDSAFPMSSIPLQFIIDIVDHGFSCRRAPSVSDSINGTTAYIAVGTIFNDTIVAESEDPDNPINEIAVMGPTGMDRSKLKRFINSTSKPLWFRDISWRPTREQIGLHKFCFMAITASKLTSMQECKELLVQISQEENTVENSDEGDDEGNFMNSEMRAAIAGGVCAIIAAIVAPVATAIYCRRRSKNSKKSDENNHPSNPGSSMTIFFINFPSPRPSPSSSPKRPILKEISEC